MKKNPIGGWPKCVIKMKNHAFFESSSIQISIFKFKYQISNIIAMKNKENEESFRILFVSYAFFSTFTHNRVKRAVALGEVLGFLTSRPFESHPAVECLYIFCRATNEKHTDLRSPWATGVSKKKKNLVQRKKNRPSKKKNEAFVETLLICQAKWNATGLTNRSIFSNFRIFRFDRIEFVEQAFIFNPINMCSWVTHGSRILHDILGRKWIHSGIHDPVSLIFVDILIKTIHAAI